MTDVVAAALQRIRESLPAVACVEGDYLPFKVSGSGDRLVQVIYGGVWAVPSYNTSAFPILQVNVLADVTRDDSGRPVAQDADTRAWMVYAVVDHAFHDVGRRWDSVISSYRHSGPALTFLPDADGAVILTSRYEIKA